MLDSRKGPRQGRRPAAVGVGLLIMVGAISCGARADTQSFLPQADAYVRGGLGAKQAIRAQRQRY